MKRWNGRGLARSFDDGETDEDGGVILADDATDGDWETVESDYSFEGYSVEFIDKVALMPLPTVTPSPSQSRR